MPKETTSTPPADQTPDNPAALETQLRAKIESEIRAEYEEKLRAAGASAPPTRAEGRPAIYYHQQGRDLVGVPVVTAGGTLFHPETGAVLVTGAKLSSQPENGRFTLRS